MCTHTCRCAHAHTHADAHTPTLIWQRKRVLCRADEKGFFSNLLHSAVENRVGRGTHMDGRAGTRGGQPVDEEVFGQ